MMKVVYTVEDYLELLVGLKEQSAFQLDSSDVSILQSLGRQVFKGIALTDRQYNLVQNKLLKYKDQFSALGYNVDSSLENLRMPIRTIDRSQYITVVNHSDIIGDNEVYESYKEKWQWVKIRFPFNKKTILIIEDLKIKVGPGDYHHKKGSHEHFFKFSERVVFEILNNFKNKNFEISDELVEYYDQLLTIASTPEKYVPGVYNLELKNAHPYVQKTLKEMFGDPNEENLLLYKDKSMLYGLEHFDIDLLSKSASKFSILSQKIAQRKNNKIFVKKTEWNIQELVGTLYELKRFPILIPLQEKTCLDQLSLLTQHFKNIVDNKQVSVLFRLDNNVEYQRDFNEFVRDNKFNNPVDKNTKIVYINKNKIPKPLVKSDWRPSCVLLFEGSTNYVPNDKLEFYEIECDLNIHYDEDVSPFYKFRSSNMVETI